MCLCKWIHLLETCCKCKVAWDNLCCGIKLKKKKKGGEFCALSHMCTSESTSTLNTPRFSPTGGWKDGQFDEFMMMNRYIIKLPFIFSWCLSHTYADTHDCTLTFRRSNKVLFLQLASAKLSGEERCLILVKTNPMHCRHPGVAHTCSTYIELRTGITLTHTESTFAGDLPLFSSLFCLNSPTVLVKCLEEKWVFLERQCAAHLCLLSLVD